MTEPLNQGTQNLSIAESPTVYQGNQSTTTKTAQSKIVKAKDSNTGLKIFMSLILILVIVLIAGVALLTFKFLPNKSNLASSNSTSSRSESKEIISTAPLQFAPSNESKTPAVIAQEQSPSVLSLRVKTQSDNGLLRSLDSEAAGTGFIITEDGIVMTNRHVIAQSCKTGSSLTSISALSGDNKPYSLEILSIDPVDDMAILRIKNTDNQKFKAVKFAESAKIKPGEDVIAIGNVLGEFGNTVTRGIVSGLNRTLQTEIKDECTGRSISADDLIQTDAAINQGNSGGPLFNGAGNVIGMNTFGASSAQNIGFAIPSSTLSSALNSYQKNGKITRARLGVVSRQLDPSLKTQYNWIPVDYGELIYNQAGTAVTPNSGAANAGLKEGDIITEVDGKKLNSENGVNFSLRREILNKTPESEITLTVIKVTGPDNKNGGYKYEQNPVTVKVKLGSISFDPANNLANLR